MRPWSQLKLLSASCTNSHSLAPLCPSRDNAGGQTRKRFPRRQLDFWPPSPVCCSDTDIPDAVPKEIIYSVYLSCANSGGEFFHMEGLHRKPKKSIVSWGEGRCYRGKNAFLLCHYSMVALSYWLINNNSQWLSFVCRIFSKYAKALSKLIHPRVKCRLDWGGRWWRLKKAQ